MTGLWQHQRDAIAFARWRGGALLHHGMGAGKTRTAIELLSSTSVALVLCPKAAMKVWERENAKVGYPLRLVVLDLMPIERRLIQIKQAFDESPAGRPTVFVTNYEAVLNEKLLAELDRLQLDAIVLDECHRLKAPGGKTSRAVARLCWHQRRSGWEPKIPRRIGLSGTPLPHSPLDAYAIFRILDPEVFGTSFREFQSRYAVMQTFGRGPRAFTKVVGFKRQDEFSDRFHSIAHSVRTEDVIELPPEYHLVREVELTPRAKKLYGEMEREMVAEIREGDLVVADNALVKLLRLRQITSGVLDGERVHTARSSALLDVLNEIEGEPLVVFAQFTSDLDDIKSLVEGRGLRYGEISGDANDYEDWLDGLVDVLGVQMQAGAEGIDLTRAAYAVYYSIGFSLGNFDQSLARLRRPGQERTVTYIHLVAPGTVDEKTYEALRQKKEVVTAVLEGYA